MAIPSQGQQFDKSQEQVKKRKWFSRRVLLIVTIIIAALAITIVWLLSSINVIPTLWASILSAILTVLGIVITVLSLITASNKSKTTPAQSHISFSTDSAPLQTPPLIIQFHPAPSPLQQSPTQIIPSVSPTVDPTISQQREQVVSDVNLREHSPDNFRREDWGEAPNIEYFYGRQKERVTLEQWIVGEHCNLVVVLGMGGVGKTSLSAKLAVQMRNEFEYIFWRSLQNAPPAETILKNCLQFLSNQEQINLPEDLDNQIPLLLEYLRKYRCLIILDNVESLLQEGNRAGEYREGYEGYARLIQRVGEVAHQSCLLLTSREKPKEFAHLEGNTSPVRSLQLPGLEQVDGQAILKDKGLFGSDETWAKLITLYSGNPLALKLVSEPIREVFGGDISEFLREVEPVFGDINDLLAQQFHRLSGLEQEIMYWLAINREAVSLDELQEDILRKLSKGTIVESLDSLRGRCMIEVSSTKRFILQPVIMEYVTNELTKRIYEEIESEKIMIFTSHALIKAQVKDYLRETQLRLILLPVAQRLLNALGKEGLEEKSKKILTMLRDSYLYKQSYAAGNLLNLLIQVKCDLNGYDFSHLTVRQAYLQGVALPDINFAYVNFIASVFTDIFGIILSVAFSPAGDLLATGTANGEVRLWHIASGTTLRTYEGHKDWVRSVAFSPDGNSLASGSEDQTLRLWDVKSSQCLKVLQGHADRVRSVAFSPDGSMVASGSDDEIVRLWDVNSGQCLKILQGHADRIWSVAFSPDGNSLASGSEDQTLRLWDVNSGQCLKVLQGHADRIWSVAFSPDGNSLVSGSEDQTVRLWDVNSGQCLKILQGHTGWVRSVAFSPDGRIVASGSEDQTLRLWDVNSGQCLKSLQGHTGWIWSVSFSPDGNSLASGSDDEIVRLWDVNSGQCLKSLQGHTDRVRSVAFSPDGRIVASGSEDQTVRLWDVKSNQCLKVLQGHTNQVRSVAFSPDGSMVASGSDDEIVRLWDVNSSQCLKVLQGHADRIWSVAFSPDGNSLVSGSEDQTLRLWDVKSSQCLKVLQGHTGWVRSVAFSPDGSTVASGSHDGTIRLWDIQTGECLKTLQGHTHRVRSVAFSPNGNSLASGSHDGTIRLWDIQTGECLKTLQGHTDRIRSVAFNPNGVTIASGSYNSTIRLWNVLTGEYLKTFRSDRPYERMNIKGVTGLTESQKTTLKALGAIDDRNIELK